MGAIVAQVADNADAAASLQFSRRFDMSFVWPAMLEPPINMVEAIRVALHVWP